MPLTLAQLEARVALRVKDPTNVIYSTTDLDDALRLALHDYSRVSPLTAETLLTLPGDGRTIALNNVTDLLSVSEVWWPYDSTLDEDENEAANQVRGFFLRWDDAQPIVVLSTIGNASPQTDDEAYLWYTKPHTVQNLDSASTTTLHAHHETMLAVGAAGYAASSEALDQVGSVHIDPKEVDYLKAWGEAQLRAWRDFLETVRAVSARGGKPWAAKGWSLDKWDPNV